MVHPVNFSPENLPLCDNTYINVYLGLICRDHLYNGIHIPIMKFLRRNDFG